MVQANTLQFLKNLQKNNNKPWFDANRALYEAAKKDVEALMNEVIAKFAKADATIGHLKAKECMFRINRDVRFSKNKEPYKNNFGAFINKGGKKSMLAGYYLHIEPGQAFVGGGLYMPEAEVLKKVRQEIDYNFAGFKKIINAAGFKKTYGTLSADKEFTLVRPPKGYEDTNPAIEFIKLKSWVATQRLSDKEITSKEFVSSVVAAFKNLQPLIQFLNTAAEGE
ncbi:MAG: DUF2461 domain-containing protein [Sphingobacteriales bacterium]|nr:MAG: DUF2461 domain-containing protein [Sphingobacteriales bacterium]